MAAAITAAAATTISTTRARHRSGSSTRPPPAGLRSLLARLLEANLPAREIEAIVVELTLGLIDRCGPGSRAPVGLITVARGGLLMNRAATLSRLPLAVLLAAGGEVLAGPPAGSLRGHWILADTLTETGATLLRSTAWLEARNPGLRLSLLSAVATEASQERLGARYPFFVTGDIGTGPDAFAPNAPAIPYDFGQIAADAGLVSPALNFKRQADSKRQKAHRLMPDSLAA